MVAGAIECGIPGYPKSYGSVYVGSKGGYGIDYGPNNGTDLFWIELDKDKKPCIRHGEVKDYSESNRAGELETCAYDYVQGTPNSFFRAMLKHIKNPNRYANLLEFARQSNYPEFETLVTSVKDYQLNIGSITNAIIDKYDLDESKFREIKNNLENFSRKYLEVEVEGKKIQIKYYEFFIMFIKNEFKDYEIIPTSKNCFGSFHEVMMKYVVYIFYVNNKKSKGDDKIMTIEKLEANSKEYSKPTNTDEAYEQTKEFLGKAGADVDTENRFLLFPHLGTLEKMVKDIETEMKPEL